MLSVHSVTTKKCSMNIYLRVNHYCANNSFSPEEKWINSGHFLVSTEDLREGKGKGGSCGPRGLCEGGGEGGGGRHQLLREASGRI